MEITEQKRNAIIEHLRLSNELLEYVLSLGVKEVKIKKLTIKEQMIKDIENSFK